MFNKWLKPECTQQPVEKCIFCQKNITEGINELKFEAQNDDGILEEFVFGKMCQRCSDVLDQSEEFTEMSEDTFGKDTD